MNCVLFNRRKYQKVRNNPEGAPPNIADCTIILAADSYLYTGAAITPSVTVKDADGATLAVNVDYFVAYKDNTEVGQGVVVVTGAGNYVGQAMKTFKITSSAWTFDLGTLGTEVASRNVADVCGVKDDVYGLSLYRDGSLGMNISTDFYKVSFPNASFSVADMTRSAKRDTGGSSSTGYYAFSCLFNNDGSKFYVCEYHGTKIRVYNTSKFEVPSNISTYASASEAVDIGVNKDRCAFSDDGYYFFAYTNEGYVDTFYRLALSKPFELSTIKETTKLAGAKLCSTDRKSIYTLGDFCFSPDGNYLIVGSSNTSAQIIKWKLGSPWDITSTITLDSYAKLQKTEGESCYGYKSGSGNVWGVAIDRTGTKMIVQFYAFANDWDAVRYKFIEYNLK